MIKDRDERRASSLDHKIVGQLLIPSAFPEKSRTLATKGDGFAETSDIFTNQVDNDKQMINHLEKKLEATKNTYKKKFNDVRDQLILAESKFVKMKELYQKEVKGKPEALLKSLMDSLNDNKLKLWKTIQDFLGDHWYESVILKKDDEKNYGINYDAIGDTCVKKAYRIGMKRASPANTDPVYSFCVSAFKAKITKLREELELKNKIINDLSQIGSELTLEDDVSKNS